ncbi:cyclopropane-fatty-acyl-phospholipid synthase family protein [Ostreiculturibacter nitratireducens]|uniref:cyclopropane-fatty-acyl-phospholipid synthase family protein n=1 Tax=Ostreiculturibacter nitratireducens TaxID=3075226 RepID=UPI0031B60F8F
MWEKLLDHMMRRFVVQGSIDLALPDGTCRSYGDGGDPKVSVTLNDPDLPRRIVLNPDMAVGEAYMDGKLTIANDDLYSFLSLAILNRSKSSFAWFQRPLEAWRRALRLTRQWNPVGRARSNVAHHYDLSGTLYDLFLDEDRQYSCAYFRSPDDTLERAQMQKKAHIAGKLLLEPGMRVLDIGCGWGGLGLTLARDFGVNVLGVTLSEEQQRVASARARKAGLDDRVEFRLMDYRHVDDVFDRIVSVGMFEHVGVPHYLEYFTHVRNKLTEDGVALIHTIGRTSPPGDTSPFIAKYIFPGGYVPAMSEVMKAVQKADLIATDIEVWRLHYAETLKHWHSRFMENVDKVREIYDDRFCRMWRYYLIGSELTFRHDRQVVFQFQLARHQEAVPLTRDYLYKGEDRLSHAAE